MIMFLTHRTTPTLSTVSYGHSLDHQCDAFFLPTSVRNRHKRDPLEKYTIIMPAFRRSDILGTVLGSYCNITEVDKIILVWNNVKDEPPFQIGNDLKCRREVLVLNQTKNLITNRFRPTSHVQTEGEGVANPVKIVSHTASIIKCKCVHRHSSIMLLLSLELIATKTARTTLG